MSDTKLPVACKTPEAQIMFPNLFTPRKANKDDAEAKYSCVAIWPKDTNLSEMEQYMDNAGINKFGEKQYLKYKEAGILTWPLLDGDKPNRSGDIKYPGCWYMNCKNTMQPGVVLLETGKKPQPVTEEGEIYGGMYGIVSVQFFAFDRNGNKGVSCSLQNFGKTADGTRMSGIKPAADDFADWGVPDSDLY